MDKQQEFVLRTLEERDIRFVRLWFTDVLGFLKSVAVAPAELEGAFAEGIGFDGSAIEGFARVYESDMLAKPDPATFQVLPWRSETPGHARGCSATSCMPDGTPSYADPRHVLKRTLAKAADLGFTFYTHPEIEFFLFRDQPEPGAGARCRSTRAATSTTSPHGIGHDFRRDAITMLESMGISVEFSHHEGAPGQQEIDLRYADALSTADNIMTFRHGDEGGRARAGRLRVVHAQAVHRAPGLGHAHPPVAVRGRPQRVLRGRRAVPAVQGRRGRSSPACCGTPREITAVTNQWVNSYKRLSGGGEAPAYVCWGHNNRSALVRVPMYKPQKGQSTRVEFRSPDSRVQPLPRVRRDARRRPQGHRGGLRAARGRRGRRVGADRRRAPGAGHRAAAGQPRPRRSGVMESSELVAETLGEHVFDFFLRNKRAEWARLPPPGHAVRAGPLPPGAVTLRRQPRLLVVQHEPDTGPGWFGDWLADAGLALDVVHPYAGDELPLLHGVRRAARARRRDGRRRRRRCPWLPGDAARCSPRP